MREHSLGITEESKGFDTGRSLQLNFNTDGGCRVLAVRIFKTNASGVMETTSVVVDSEDAEAMVEFLQTFIEERNIAEDKVKGA
jgi:hypothetical protein